jgi:hypothetical protein
MHILTIVRKVSERGRDNIEDKEDLPMVSGAFMVAWKCGASRSE